MSAQASRVVEAERALLGALMLEPVAWGRVADLIGADDFNEHSHRRIYRAIDAVVASNHPPDPVTVSEQLEQANLLETVGGSDYLARLVEETPSAANVRAYADIVRKAAIRRRLRETAARFIQGVDQGVDVDPLVEEIRDALERTTSHATRLPLREESTGDLRAADLPPPRFVIEPLLPREYVTLLSGHGDAGKTLLALTLAAHVACGTRFGDLFVFCGKVLFVSLEDTAALIRLRLQRIACAYGLDVDAVGAGITLLEVDEDSDGALASEHAEGGTRRLLFTAAFEQIKEAAVGHDLIVVDNASDAYDANENERRMVRRFLRELQRIGQANGAAVLLLAHIDKIGARFGTAGETYSGSTAWHNSVRSRLALIETDVGLELRHEKCNVAKKLEDSIVLERAEHGVPVPLSRARRAEAEASDERAVLAAIEIADAAGVIVPTANSGPKTAIHIITTRPGFPDDLAKSPRQVRVALAALERQGVIRRESYRDEHRKLKERFKCASQLR